MSDQDITETPNAPAWDALVGEGKKYQSTEDALSALVHAQEHISNLEQENAGFREKETTNRTIEEILNAIKPSDEGEGQHQSVSREDLAELVSRTLDQKTKEQAATTNAERSYSFLKETYGDKWKEVKAAKAADLGISEEFLDSIASHSVEAFKAHFPTQSPANNAPLPSQSTVHIRSGEGSPQQGTSAWYKQQRKERGNEWYLSADIQLQRMKDAERLGDNY